MLQKNTIEPGTLELLEHLCADANLKNFSLAGGTALALQIGHRKSIDLDFFTIDVFDADTLLQYLEEKYNFSLDYSALYTLKGHINSIKIEFLTHKYPLIDPIIESDKVRLYSVRDITAMKLNAIAGNGTRSKDFIDVYFLLEEYTVNQMVKFYELKYKNRNLFHVVKSLHYFDDLQTHDWPIMVKEKGLKLEEVKKRISKSVERFLKENDFI
ncbi:hypothetical protein L21SP5_01951 [Salinivirga cyanobacteriivorans]|uniref:Nucleotidyl transferase AbiEii toxin, Type IV TA system n=1 Tax=Salinivirga cyanobacteriivorans TaxID=1307839 RepID=A0A0S2HZY8_9BACT|nr:nucleotidyl transferase AbiEii/AbiGii toxin family protein [Salinivirga cyanobacteriivorans]ALO15590.1 hypothetical protein L21SP5_01951 [Salinivirga cyanobacteriivorans]